MEDTDHSTTEYRLHRASGAEPSRFARIRSRWWFKLIAWAALAAVRDSRAFAVDGNAYFNRPGPRLVESAEILAEICHPESHNFGHEGSAWCRLGASPETDNRE